MREPRRRLRSVCSGIWGISLGLVLLGPLGIDQPSANADPTEPVAVEVFGTEVDLRQPLRAQLDAVSAAFLSERIQLSGPDLSIQRSRHWFGAEVDHVRLLGWVQSLKDPRSRATREAVRRGSRTVDLPVPVTIDNQKVFDLLLAAKDDLDARPVEARIDAVTGEVRPHRDGIQVDVWGTLSSLDAALRRPEVSSVELVVSRTLPRHTTESLADVTAGTVLGKFRTRYNGTEEAADRTYNLRVAAEQIDGLVLMPGEEFDFNDFVGERNEANGYRVATVIAAGELVDGIGGGTCQISGTLHAAVLFAGLPILERRPHSRPSSYIKLGLDAAVSYPSLNFRFQNDRDFPVVIGFTVEDGWVRAILRGASHDSQVSFVRRIESATGFEERENQDSELPTGVRVLAQRGVPGFRVRTYRVIRNLTSNQAVRQSALDTYPPTTQIWRVGTGGAMPEEFEPPRGDTHPEYTADSYLSMTQGAHIDGTVDVHRAGRYGTPGWTVRMGFTSEVRSVVLPTP